MNYLPSAFYMRDDVVAIARELLGKALFTLVDTDELTGGIIIETEAYRGAEDKASHAYKNRLTQRTKPLFQDGGIAYIYLCYGIHYLLNVVTNVKNIPHAVLIRALLPTHGLQTMRRRRSKLRNDQDMTSGPGSLTQALGVDKRLNGSAFNSPSLWIAETPFTIAPHLIASGPRIGIAYAAEHAQLPWRFYLNELPRSLTMDINVWASCVFQAEGSLF